MTRSKINIPKVLTVMIVLAMILPVYSQDSANKITGKNITGDETQSNNGNQKEITGKVIVQIHGCCNTKYKGPRTKYVLDDGEGPAMIHLDTTDIDTSTLKSGRRVRIRGAFKRHPVSTLGRKIFKISAVKVVDPVEGAEASDDEGATQAASPQPQAVTTQALNTLVIFTHTLDRPLSSSSMNGTLSKLFTSTTSNVSDYFKQATYGHYSLSLGASVEVNINLNSTDPYGDLETAALTAASGEGYNRNDYDRTIIMVDNDHGYAYAGLGGDLSVYPDMNDASLDIYVHELGHNFGFHHSGVGTDQYADKTSALGGMHWGTESEVYNVAKLHQNNWFAPFEGSYQSLTEDATFDVYPVHVSPADTPGVRAVNINGTDYYFSYLKNSPPYAWLEDSAHRDKVILYNKAPGMTVSWREAVVGVGGVDTTTGSSVTFEQYGPNNEYAIVSFDLNDGNAKPVANAQSLSMYNNTSKSITLTGSDADGDSLSYSIAFGPSNGTLSGSGVNQTYTPNTNYIGSDSFVFKVDDGNISSYATVSITVNEFNFISLDSPSTDSCSIPSGVGVLLETTVIEDPDNPGPVTVAWSKVSGPGTASFESPAEDDTAVTFSQTGTYVLRLSADNGSTQTSLDITVNYGGSSPGLWYGTASGNINTSTANPKSQLLVNVASKTEDSIAGNTTEIYTGQIYDADGSISFTEHIDDKARIWIDGNLVINNDSWNSRSSTGNLNLTPGWHDIEIRISNGSGGSGPAGSPGIGYDPAGGTAWQTLVDSGDGSFLRSETGNTGAFVDAGSNDSGVVNTPVNLDGTVNDADGDPLTTSWLKVDGPTGSSFGGSSSVDTTFTAVSGGNYTLRLVANDGTVKTFDDVVISVTGGSGTVKNDFNGDGKSDVLLRNSSDGRWYMHTLNGSSVLSSGFSNMVTSMSWSFKGTGDFDGDGRSDVLLRHNTDGRWYMHTLNGSAVLSSGFSNMVTSTSWSFKGIGDFDGDGRSDVLLRHNTDGRWYMHTLNGSAVLSSGFSNMVTSTSWSFKGTGDFDGDGKSDVLLRHNTDGRWYMHTLNGSAVLSSGFSNMVTSTSWSFKGTGDFDGDGKSDVLLRHNTDGRWYMHTLNGSSVLSSGFSNMVTSTNWSFKDTGDFDGDGKSDVLLRHNTDGRWYMHTLNGSSVLSSSFSNMVTSTNWAFANNQPEEAPADEDAAAVLHSTESILSTNDSYEDLAVVLDILSVSSEAGDFTLKVITAEGEFIFYLSSGEEFSYAVLSDNEFTVIYSNSDEILEMLSKLFDTDEIIDIQVMTY